ncbi:MAG: hypothetical protein VYE77_02995 [Planctomycetota bacterium]|nr:hypothetical protein [Planctomycetota bacterium]
MRTLPRSRFGKPRIACFLEPVTQPRAWSVTEIVEQRVTNQTANTRNHR